MAPSKDIEIGMDGGNEEKFVTIQEEEQKEFETPHIVRRGLTEVSAMFDRNGKGYLDDTERALRRMDSQNKGHLGIDKVCIIFESLQAEQERSAELLEALRLESKKAMSLKWGVIALSCFAVLLALANIGTSFAVSKLVKETKVSPTGDLVAKDTGDRLGTTSKLMIIDMEDIASVEPDRRHRALQAKFGICTDNSGATNDGVVTAGEEPKFNCNVTGVVNRNKAQNIHKALTFEGVTEVLLKCNGTMSSILGGRHAPPGQPGLFEMSTQKHFIFPDGADTNNKYMGVQDRQTANGTTCEAKFKLAFYCPEDDPKAECWVLSAAEPTPGCTLPEVCRPKPTRRPTSAPLAQPMSASRGGAGGGGAQP